MSSEDRIERVEIYEQGTGKLLRVEEIVLTDEQYKIKCELKRLSELREIGKDKWTFEDVKDLIEILLNRI